LQVNMTIAELKEKNITELSRIARTLEIPGASGLRKQDLIFKILQAQSEKEGHIFADGVLEILPDGLVATPALQSLLIHGNVGSKPDEGLTAVFALPAYAALAEAAADTVSSEIGQVLGGTPRMLTTLRRVPPGTDGAVSLAGTLAGVLAAGVIAAIGTLTLGLPWSSGVLVWLGGVFGLFFDSLLGATLERKGWLNNDAVNFLSTAGAAGFVLAVMMWVLSHAVI
jgi:uncharacterized protein (TIGR00297 family)